MVFGPILITQNMDLQKPQSVIPACPGIQAPWVALTKPIVGSNSFDRFKAVLPPGTLTGVTLAKAGGQCLAGCSGLHLFFKIPRQVRDQAAGFTHKIKNVVYGLWQAPGVTAAGARAVKLGVQALATDAIQIVIGGNVR